MILYVFRLFDQGVYCAIKVSISIFRFALNNGIVRTRLSTIPDHSVLSIVGPSLTAVAMRVKGDDIEAIKASMDALMKVSHSMAEAMYKASGAQPGAEGAGPQPGEGAADAGAQQQEPPKQDKDGAVDADFEVVD